VSDTTEAIRRRPRGNYATGMSQRDIAPNEREGTFATGMENIEQPGESNIRGSFQDRGMPKAYWINSFRSVNDPHRLAEYIKLAGPVMRRSGGRFLARGRPAKVYEAGVTERTIVIEFDSADQAIAAYESPGYQDALRALGDGAERDLRIVEATSEA
jgi:uncharacterized protein (DUF1330 family)